MRRFKNTLYGEGNGTDILLTDSLRPGMAILGPDPTGGMQPGAP